jgi:hypothetical protein
LLTPLTELANSAVAAAMERVLDRFAPTSGHLRIDRLDIDAGDMPLEILQANLARAVSDAMETALQDRLAAGIAATDGPSGADAEYLTERSATLEAFAHFLRSGTLPWSFRLPDGGTLEERARDILRDAPDRDAARRDLVAIVLPALRSPYARRRLVMRYRPDFLFALLAAASDAAAHGMRDLMELLESGDTGGPPTGLEREVWAEAFAAVAESRPFSSSGILVAAIRALGIRSRDLVSRSSRTLERVLARISAEMARDVDAILASLRDTDSVRRMDAAGERATDALRAAMRDDADACARRLLLAAIGLRLQSMPGSKAEIIRAAADDGASARVHDPAKRTDVSERRGLSDDRHESTDATRTETRGEDADHREDEHGDTLSIDTAGLVLLHPFLARFFTGLGIAGEDAIARPERAVALLHFLATGRERAEEHELILEKLLCGIPIAVPVEPVEALTADEIEESAALLHAVIGHWSVLKDTGIDALRGAFLVRPGLLSWRGDGEWLLRVEPRGIDVLLDRLPWAISMIRLPWMRQMVHVEWEHA